ncbi:hypothetical protein [Cycloclasticus sp.]|uniref:hypothetical protein n=1 Tax=Cycloclasticus sp. TaxID=2024830 RepID=UPI000C100809|nr:hypothetical protein [Cycloclasticus sp.]PHR52139.1 MAG: hypothetical protein COA48_03455 [Cycloclasticus sp.]
MEALIGVVGTIIGATIAGVFLFHKDKRQYNFEKEKARRELLLTKYEEIYSNLADYSGFAQEISVLMIGDAGYGSKFDATKLQTNLKENKLKMNVMYYAPELQDDIVEIDAKQTVVARALTKYLLDQNNNEESKGKLTGETAIASAELSKLTAKAQEKLAALVRVQLDA